MRGIIALRKQKGFSMAELMIGVAILVIALCGALLTYVQCMLFSQTARNQVTAATDAQYVLEQMRALPSYDDLDDYVSSPPTFSNLPSEQIAFDPAPTIGGNLATVTVKVSWQERQSQRSFSLSTLIAR